MGKVGHERRQSTVAWVPEERIHIVLRESVNKMTKHGCRES